MTTETEKHSTIPLETKNLTLVTFPSTLKLTATNYLTWKTQIQAILYGLDLYKFIDGSNPEPKPTTDAKGVSKPHPDHAAWFRQDKLLFGALLSPTIATLITNAPTSLVAWNILSNTYASTSRGHIKQLQYRLNHCSKTPENTITEFMQSVKTLVDELAILGKEIDVEDVTDIVLNGLDQQSYKPVIDAIQARDTPISFHELHEKLINHELSLNKNLTPSPNLHQPATAFAATHRHGSKPWHYHKTQNSNNSPGILPTPTHTPTRPFLGKCQFCFKQGHSLTSCHNFKKEHPNITLPPLPRHTNTKPQAHMMTTQHPNNSNNQWLFDSGASHHITNDISALSLHSPYDGTDDLIIGDGLPLQSNPSSRNSQTRDL